MSDEEEAPLGPGMTRDCRDPWSYVEIHTNGEVRPCCVREPIGNLADGPLAEVLRNEPIRQLRAMLLTGKLDAACTGCRARAPIPTKAFVEKIRGLRAEVAVPRDFDAKGYLRANPDVAAAGVAAEAHFVTYGYLEGREVAADTPPEPQASWLRRALGLTI